MNGASMNNHLRSGDGRLKTSVMDDREPLLYSTQTLYFTIKDAPRRHNDRTHHQKLGCVGYKTWLGTTRRCPQHLALAPFATRHSPLEMTYPQADSFVSYALDNSLDTSGMMLSLRGSMRLDSCLPSQVEQSVGSSANPRTPWTSENSYLDIMRSSEYMFTHWYSDLDPPKARRSPIRVRRRNVQVGTIVPEPRATRVPKLVQCTVEGCGKVLTKGAMRRHKETHKEQDKWRCCGIPIEMAFGLANADTSSVRRMVGGCWEVFSRKDALERHLKNPNNPCIGDVERAELLGRRAIRICGVHRPEFAGIGTRSSHRTHSGPGKQNLDEQHALQGLMMMAERLPSSGANTRTLRLAAPQAASVVDASTTAIKVPSRPARRKVVARQEGTRRSKRLLEKASIAPALSNERQGTDGSKPRSKAETDQCVLRASNGSGDVEEEPTPSEEKSSSTKRTKRKRDENNGYGAQITAAKKKRTCDKIAQQTSSLICNPADHNPPPCPCIASAGAMRARCSLWPFRMLSPISMVDWPVFYPPQLRIVFNARAAGPCEKNCPKRGCVRPYNTEAVHQFGEKGRLRSKATTRMGTTRIE
ncbi:predicted protein [Postia placenta Mad-698-R]|nr:predicted protein [Postia placenta Mad-698-R]